MADEQTRLRSASETVPRSGEPAGDVGSQQRPEHAPGEIGDATFPIAVRGYDRHAVDAYVARVSRVIAQLELRSSPQAAVMHAVDQVSEQLGGVLQNARQAAEGITAEALAEAEATTAKARAEAAQLMEDAELQANQLRGRSKQQSDELLTRAKEQAGELMLRAEEQVRAVHEDAEPRLRELEADTEAVWEARRKLLEDLPRMATELMEIAGAASARLRRPSSASGAPVQPGNQSAEGTPADAGGAPPAGWPAQAHRVPGPRPSNLAAPRERR